MDKKPMEVHVTAQRLDEDEMLGRVIAYMTYHAYQAGVRESGEQVTYIVPTMDAGPTLETSVELSDYEIIIRKV